jgi:site-specific DNA recombinase
MQTKKVGIWIRVSTEDQAKGESPLHHEQRARYYAESKQWQVLEVYHLEAVSGKSVMEHAETKRMLKDIRAGHITGLIFSKLARLARNTRELLDFADIFRECNADLVSLQESIDTSTPAGRLFYTMISAMAQWEREEIASRVQASIPIRAKLGKPLSGSAPYGYKWENKQFVVDEQEAPVRKLIYELFLKTKRKKTVARELTKRGLRTRNDKEFSNITIGRLLRDTCAKGVRRANFTTGDGVKVEFKPQSEWVQLECPAIVSVELWEKCNHILDEQEKKEKPVGRKAMYLLSGFVYCTCGKKMYVYTQSPVYKCKPCKRKVGTDVVDEIYHAQLKKFLLTDTDTATFNATSETAIAERQTLLGNCQAELGKLKKRLKEFVDKRLEDELSKEDFQALYQPLKEQIKQLEDQLPKLEADIDILKMHHHSADTVQQEAQELYEKWHTMPFEERRNIVEHLTEKVIIEQDAITISLSYDPSLLPLQNGGKSEQRLCIDCVHRGRLFLSFLARAVPTHHNPENNNRGLA